MSEYLSRGIDYLGDLGAKLRDLQGHRTLAHELIQNADDAAEATWMCFDVQDDALVVDNDGRFSDCGKMELSPCPWLEERGHRCDFHRFRVIAAGDKRSEQGTTGAFGIGFIAVYQITDLPELVSNGRHWVMNEVEPEGKRIRVCPSCTRCSSSLLPGTRFILPWARDAKSELRVALKAAPISDGTPTDIVQELKRSLPIAMLFLKRLERIDVKRDGRLLNTIRRTQDDSDVIINVDDERKGARWHLIHGDFDTTANELRARHGARIEEKRSANVAIAISADEAKPGVLCACLPTEHDVGLPFHVHADFYPTNDRKRVILGGGDFQSEWNREALRAAAHALAMNADGLPELIGATRFWALSERLKEVADRASVTQQEAVLAEFWNALEPRLRHIAAVPTTEDVLVRPHEALLLLQRTEADSIGALTSLGLPIVHEDLRPHQSMLHSNSVGVVALGVMHIAEALTQLGVNRRLESSELPPALKEHASRCSLWSELELLLERQAKNQKAVALDKERLGRLALAPGRDNAYWPLDDLYRADEETATLFASITPDFPFLAPVDGLGDLALLCPAFDAEAAVDLLEGVDEEELFDAWRDERLSWTDLFEWFENRRAEVLGDADLKRRFAELPIFPSPHALHALTELSLPGDYKDELGLADVVDLDALGGRRDFLRALGMRELTFKAYATQRIPAAFDDDTVAPDIRRSAVLLLASKLGELKDDNAAMSVLRSTKLVECTDGVFRSASDCYFDTQDVRDCVARPVYAKAPPGEHEASIIDLYSSLGVARAPRLADVVTTVQGVTTKAPTDKLVERVRTILNHLSSRVSAEDELPKTLKPLVGMAWLPGRDKTDRWYKPAELYAVYQEYLFASQANFVDAPRPLQDRCNALFRHVGVHITPTTTQVVRHLLHCVATSTPVSQEVYVYLNRQTDDPALSLLADGKCLWIDGDYRAGAEVYWSEHPFGNFRWRLGEDLRSYGHFLERVGVKDKPDYEDALAVLNEIASDSKNSPIADDVQAVLWNCWEMLESALRAEELSDEDLAAELGDVKCVPNAAHILYVPERIFFDNRGLAAKFGTFLAQNVITRPLGSGDALAAAGVRQLSSAVEIEVLERRNVQDAHEMKQRLLERRNEIGRVLAAQGTGLDANEALGRIRALDCNSVELLKVQHRLEAFGKTVNSSPEFVSALYVPDEHLLIFNNQEGKFSWAAVARELSFALFPDEDPGRFSSGLKDVLASDTTEAASATLDELGLAHVDTSEAGAAVAGGIATGLGTDEPVQKPDADDWQPTSEAAAEDDTSEMDESAHAGDLDVDDAIAQLLGTNGDGPTAPIPDPLGPEPVGAGGGAGRGGDGSTDGARGNGRGVRERTSGVTNGFDRQDKRAPGGVGGRPFISYVGADPDEEEKDPDGLDQQQRLDLEDKAIDFIRSQEPQLERTPPNNEGFDLTESDEHGAIVRWIEVKAMTSAMKRGRDATMSYAQFKCAQEHGDAYWLYVVENAGTDAQRLVKIQDPAGKTKTFTFDKGWLDIAEIVDAVGEQVHGED